MSDITLGISGDYSSLDSALASASSSVNTFGSKVTASLKASGRSTHQLGSDVGGLKGDWRGAGDAASQFGQRTRDELKETEKQVKGLSGLIQGALIGGLAGGFAAALSNAFTGIGKLASYAFKKLMEVAPGLLELYGVQSKAEKKLEVVVKATGGAAGYSADQLKRMAAEMQNITTVGDEVIINAQAVLATFTNVRGEVFKDALMSASDLATILDTDLKGATIQIGKALNDPVAGITALSRAGVSFTQSQKDTIRTLMETGDVVGAQTIVLDELKKEFGGASEAMANTFGGKMQQFQNRLGDVGEAIGKKLSEQLIKLAPIIDTALVGLENSIPIIGDMIEWVGELAESLAKKLTPAFNALLDGAITVFSAMQILFNNWKDVADVAYTALYLGAVKTVNVLKHLFLNVAPEVFKWFGEQFNNIMESMAHNLQAVAENMLSNFGTFFEKMKALIQGQDPGDYVFKALNEGFKLTLDEWPDIAERQVSGLEKVLEEQLASQSSDLFGDLRSRFESNKAELLDLFKKKDAEEMDLTPSDTGDYSGNEPKKSKGGGSAFEDLLALNKRIASASAQQDPIAKAIKQEAEKDREVAEEIRDETKKVAEAIAGPGEKPLDEALKEIWGAEVGATNFTENMNLPSDDVTTDIIDNLGMFGTAGFDAGQGTMTSGEFDTLQELQEIGNRQAKDISEMRALIGGMTDAVKGLTSEATDVKHKLPLVGALG